MDSELEQFDFETMASGTGSEEQKVIKAETRSCDKFGILSNIDFDVISRIGSYQVVNKKTVVVTVSRMTPRPRHAGSQGSMPSVAAKALSIKNDFPMRNCRVGVKFDHGLFRRRLMRGGSTIKQAKNCFPAPMLVQIPCPALEECMLKVGTVLAIRNQADFHPTGKVNIGLEWQVLLKRMAVMNWDDPSEFQDVLHLRMALYLDGVLRKRREVLGMVLGDDVFSTDECKIQFASFCFLHELQHAGHFLTDDASESLSLRDYRTVMKMLQFSEDPCFYDEMEGYLTELLTYSEFYKMTNVFKLDGDFQKHCIASLAHSMVHNCVRILRRRMDMLSMFGYQEDDLKSRGVSVHIDCCTCCTFSHRIHELRRSVKKQCSRLTDVVPKCEFLWHLLDVPLVQKNGGIMVMGKKFEPKDYIAAIEAFLTSQNNVSTPAPSDSLKPALLRGFNRFNQDNYDFAKLALIIYLSHMHQVCYVDQIVAGLSDKTRLYHYFEAHRSATVHIGWRMWQEKQNLCDDMIKRVASILVNTLSFREDNAQQICRFAMSQIVLRNTARSFLHDDVLEYTSLVQPEKTLKNVRTAMNRVMNQVHTCLLCYEDENCFFCLKYASTRGVL